MADGLQMHWCPIRQIIRQPGTCRKLRDWSTTTNHGHNYHGG